MHVSQTNGDTLHLLQTGQISVGLIQSSAATGAAKTTPGLKVAYLPKVTLLPGGIGVDAKVPAAEQAEAQKFIDFVLSGAGQHQMQIGDPTGDSLYWPVVPGTAPNPALASLRSISHQAIDPYTWGPGKPRSTPGSRTTSFSRWRYPSQPARGRGAAYPDASVPGSARAG